MFLLKLIGTLSLDEDFLHNDPKILPIRSKGMLLILFAITPFALLNLVDGLGHVGIERRQHPRLALDAQLLDLGAIKAEILLAQRTDTHEFHLTLENIDEHRKLINP